MTILPPGILDAFGIDPVEIATLPGGLSRAVWKVRDAGDTFVVRRHDSSVQTLAAVTSELAWLGALASDVELPTPVPVRRVNEELGPVASDGANGEPAALWTAWEWVDGETLGRLPDVREAGLIGTMIAALHGHARSWSPPPGFLRPTYDAAHFEAAARALVHQTGTLLDAPARRLLDDALRLATAALSRLGLGTGQVGPIHADLHDGNIVYGGDPRRAGAIDFGRFGWGCWALDLAMALHYLDDDLAEPVVASYHAGFGLSADGRAALPALCFLAAIDNLAVLSAIPEEADFVAAELDMLKGRAARLVG